MFIDPAWVYHAAQASITYSYDSLTDELISEHTPDVNTFYDYDDNGSLVAEYNDVSPIRDYTYNLRGWLSSVTAGGVTVSYTYDADGFRVSADNGQTAEHYLVDPFNHTGYAQVLKQTTDAGGVGGGIYSWKRGVLASRMGI